MVSTKNNTKNPLHPALVPARRYGGDGDSRASRVSERVAADKWPRESAGPIAQVSEFFAHHVKVEDLQNEKITSLDYTGTWNRITPWLPWMLMGQRPGLCQYACFMGTTQNLEEILSRNVLDYCEKNYKKYLMRQLNGAQIAVFRALSITLRIRSGAGQVSGFLLAAGRCYIRSVVSRDTRLGCRSRSTRAPVLHPRASSGSMCRASDRRCK